MAVVKTNTRLVIGVILYVCATPLIVALMLVEALSSSAKHFYWSLRYQFTDEYMEGWRRASRIYKSINTATAQKGGE